MVDKDLVFQLRQETGMGMLDCKRALEKSNGDYANAKIFLAEQWEITKMVSLITYR